MRPGVEMKELDEMESSLRELQPTRPRAELWLGIEEQMQRGQSAEVGRQSRSVLSRFGNLVLPFSAAALLVIAISIVLFFAREEKGEGFVYSEPSESELERATAAPESEHFRYHPVNARRVLYHATKEGTILLQDEIPLRRMRYQFIDSFVWEDSQRGASLEIEVPWEEVVLVEMEVF